MRRNAAWRPANLLAVIFICAVMAAGSAAAIGAQEFSIDGDRFIDSGKNASVLRGQDEFECPRTRFPKDQVFDDFRLALASPEKVRCLDPNVEGDALKMKRLPGGGIGKMVNLEVLSLSCVESLEALPEEIGNLKNLRELIIDNGNGCTMNVTIQGSIGRLENLRVLRLFGALDYSDGTASRRARPKIKTLPAAIGNLRRLEVLDLGRNGLTALPPQIASLTQLKTLGLAYNELRVLPAFVGNFKNLKELTLDANRKIALPASLAKLRGLSVSMGNNRLKRREQSSLRTRFPHINFSFENEYEDETANEQAR